MDFIELFNGVVRVVKPMEPNFEATDLGSMFKNLGVDSLDSIMITIYMCEIYEVPEEIAKGWTPSTIRELHDLLMEHKTKDPESVEASLALIK